MKNLFLLLVVISTAFLTSCAVSIGPEVAGEAAGKAILLGYNKIAETKSPEFRQKVESLWAEVENIGTVDELVNQMDHLEKAFNLVINDQNLTEEEALFLISFRNLLTRKVKAIMRNKLQSNQDAIDFLIGFRNGVDDAAGMLKLLKEKGTAPQGYLQIDKPMHTLYVRTRFGESEKPVYAFRLPARDVETELKAITSFFDDMKPTYVIDGGNLVREECAECRRGF